MPGVPEARTNELLRRYPLRRRRVPIAGRSISLVVPDEQAHRRKGEWVSGLSRGGEPPYWARIWPAAVAIARELLRGQALDGCSVLDVGCGLGLPGVAAAIRGGRVHFVDREPAALAFAQWNASAQPEVHEAPDVRCIDWRGERVDGRFDLILLSDVTYHASHLAPLRQLLSHALAPSGCVLHAEPGREVSSRFLQDLGQDYALHEVHRRTVAPSHAATVRLVLAARNTAELDTWLHRFGRDHSGSAEPADRAVARTDAGPSRAPSERTHADGAESADSAESGDPAAGADTAETAGRAKRVDPVARAHRADGADPAKRAHPASCVDRADRGDGVIRENRADPSGANVRPIASPGSDRTALGRGHGGRA